MRDPEGRTLRSMLVDIFSRSFSEPLTDDEFNAAALRIFAWQYARNVPYARFCDRRERTPREVTHWTEIPAVPTAAFREVDLVAGSAADADAVFRTSGTTGGADRRGVHYVLDVSIYHFSLIPNFAACVLPDGAELTMLSLVPSSSELPDSSLSHMVGVVLERLGGTGSGWYASATHGIDDARLAGALHDAQRDGRPVCVLGTSFAFVHLLDRMAERGERHDLPTGSRLMDTGGYKGRSREVEVTDLRRLYQELLGIPASHCVNEYGMTEMCSQFYDSVLRDGGERRKVVPPWVRTRIVDPGTLQPLSDGETSLLQHFDLANAGSVCAIQTEDQGVRVEGGFQLLGRAPGATPRGCSIAMDILLEAVNRKRD
jgi:hypothetical protein